MAAKNLSKWEEEHAECIKLLLAQAERKIAIEKTKNVRGPEEERQNWLDFRYTVYDLYSVLDYAYYFLYCHFHHKEPAPNERAIDYGFPYEAKGVRTSTSESQDKRADFVKKIAERLGDNEAAKAVGKFILTLQPTLEVDAGGKKSANGPEASGNAKQLAMLHSYRNCVTHRDLIIFVREAVEVEYNKTSGKCKLVTESQKERGDFDYYKLQGPDFWIELPDTVRGETRHRSVLKVLPELRCFVRKTITTLLQIAGINVNGMHPAFHCGIHLCLGSHLVLYVYPAVSIW